MCMEELGKRESGDKGRSRPTNPTTYLPYGRFAKRPYQPTDVCNRVLSTPPAYPTVT